MPLLEEEDGFILPDSHAIMAYLVAQYGKNDSLYPKNDNRQRAIIDHRLHFDSSVLFNRGLCISVGRSTVYSKHIVLYNLYKDNKKKPYKNVSINFLSVVYLYFQLLVLIVKIENQFKFHMEKTFENHLTDNNI